MRTAVSWVISLALLSISVCGLPISVLGLDGPQPPLAESHVLTSHSLHVHPSSALVGLSSTSATPTSSLILSTIPAASVRLAGSAYPSAKASLSATPSAPMLSPYALGLPEPSQGVPQNPDMLVPPIRTTSDSHAREASQWKVIGLAVVCVTGIALVTLSIACFDSWSKFVTGVCCCRCCRKEDLGEEDFIADSQEKKDWHNKMAMADGYRYPAWGSQGSINCDVCPGPPPASEHISPYFNSYTEHAS